MTERKGNQPLKMTEAGKVMRDKKNNNKKSPRSGNKTVHAQSLDLSRIFKHIKL